MTRIALLCLFLLSLSLCLSLTYSSSPAKLTISDENDIILENGYTKVAFSGAQSSLTSIYADFSGLGKYGPNVLSKPFSLEVVVNNVTNMASNTPKYNVITNSEDVVKVEVSALSDTDGIVQETWLLTLKKDNRFLDIAIDGAVIKSGSVTSIRHGLYTGASSLYGLFDRGIVQMMGNIGSCLGSNQSIGRAYMLGNGMSLDALISYPPTFDASTTEVVFLSTASDRSFQSALQHVVVGSYPRKSLKYEDAWSKKCWDGADSKEISPGQTWSFSLSLGPNDMDFPVYLLHDASSSVSPVMPELDVQTLLTGVYSSAAGCFQSYYDLRQGTIAPTISHPDVGYSPNTNFFDPDNFITLSAILFAGDDYLQNEVRLVLERTGETMCGIGSEQVAAYCQGASLRRRPLITPKSPHRRASSLNPRDGQLMHHFINLVPTYESIAASEQLGPNVFWSLCVLKYASVTGDLAWLEKMRPYLELSSHFLFSFFDEEVGLLMVPGPLWIDVLVRENYTSDSNAILPYIFRELADAFDALDADDSWSSELRRVADAIVTNMNSKLWEVNQDDHYFTQLNLDLTTSRDFIDYDANLLAVAFDVAPDRRVGSILRRVDRGAYTHVRGTWCCELAYTGDADDCYIVGGDVCGDSVVTLARIGWADAHARKRVRDIDTFNNLLLKPLQDDVVQYTWLYERYDTAGNQIRTPFYFEYPSLVTMMLTEVRYGIEMGVASVKVKPFRREEEASDPFAFSFGSMDVRYDPSSSDQVASLRFQGSGAKKDISIYGLPASTAYDVSGSGKCSQSDKLSAISTAHGVLEFSWEVQSSCTMLINVGTVSA
jgi:hypothetical protein